MPTQCDEGASWASNPCQHLCRCDHAAHPAPFFLALLQGLGTDDKTLIATIVPRTNEELQVLRQVYQKEIGRDLVEDVKSETSGDYEKALVGTLLTRAQWDAKCLRSFMKGIGESLSAPRSRVTHAPQLPVLRTFCHA